MRQEYNQRSGTNWKVYEGNEILEVLSIPGVELKTSTDENFKNRRIEFRYSAEKYFDHIMMHLMNQDDCELTSEVIEQRELDFVGENICNYCKENNITIIYLSEEARLSLGYNSDSMENIQVFVF